MSSITIIHIERTYANRILQVLIEIYIFGKRKNREKFFAICTCFNYFVIYWVKKIGSIALIVF